MALGKLPVPGRPTIWMIVGQGPIAPSVGAGGGCLDIFTLLYLFPPLSPSLWETARYRLKYCLKGPLNPKQPTNFSLYRTVSQREGEKAEKGKRRVKMSKQPPPAPTASAVGPCPTVIQIVGRPGTGSLPRTIAPPDHPFTGKYYKDIVLKKLKKKTIIRNDAILLVLNIFVFYMTMLTLILPQ